MTVKTEVKIFLCRYIEIEFQIKFFTYYSINGVKPIQQNSL